MGWLSSRTVPAWLRGWKVPSDGIRRYHYDIWQPLALLVLTTCFATIIYTTSSARASTNLDDLFFCNADGNVEKTVPGYRPLWDPQLYFTINIAFGQFAFSTVKIVDATWDVVVGRGGQMLMAVIAYRVLRRSLTLTMETYTVAIPTVATFYCQQIGVVSLIQLTKNFFWHWEYQRPTWRQPFHLGRLRVAMQVFACVYVLVFATLVSVMTGYRASLKGYFGYDAQNPGQLIPIGDLEFPLLALSDANRTGLSESLVVTSDAISFPPNTNSSSTMEAIFDAKDFLEGSRDFVEPYGLIVDCKRSNSAPDSRTLFDQFSIDYCTCLGVRLMKYQRYAKAHTLKCAAHECSCSIPADGQDPDDIPCDIADQKQCFLDAISANMTSTIVVNDRLWKPSPPLDISFPVENGLYTADGFETFAYESGFRSGATFHLARTWALPKSSSKIYMHNGVGLSDTTVKATGRCIAEDAYSWGFSSLLLLTFCSYTAIFALTLILLQTDVFFNSRCDRNHQSHSLYTDVLYLAEELKNTFGHNVKDHMQAPEDFSRQVERRKEGLHLEVDKLPLSRWREWKLLLNLVSMDIPEHADEESHELRTLRAHDRAIAATTTRYGRIVSEVGDELSLEAGQDSERSSTAGR